MRQKKPLVGIAIALALVALILTGIFVPVTPRPRVHHDTKVWDDFQAVGQQARHLDGVSVVVSVKSPREISVSGRALHGKTITLDSVADFPSVLERLPGARTAVVGFDSSLGVVVLNPPPEILQTQARLRQMLADRGFHDPVGR